MDDVEIIFIIIFLIGLFLAFIIFLKYSKGSLEFTVNKENLNYEGIISGKITLKAKKLIKSNSMSVTFSGGTSIILDNRVDTNGRSFTCLYKKEIKLEHSRKYHKGTYYFDFEFTIPKIEEIKDFSEEEKKNLKNGNLFLRWKLETLLDTKGVNLYRSKLIEIKSI